MKAVAVRSLFVVLGLACILGLAGCEGNDAKDWVAPASIGGTWLHTFNQPLETGAVGEGYVIQQNGVSVSVTHFFKRADGSTLGALSAWPGTYDPATGLVSYYLHYAEVWHYFRFTSDTEMWGVSDAGSDTGFQSYIRQ